MFCTCRPIVSLGTDLNVWGVNFIYQMEDELRTENIQIYLHPLQLYSLANIFFYAK